MASHSEQTSSARFMRAAAVLGVGVGALIAFEAVGQVAPGGRPAQLPANIGRPSVGPSRGPSIYFTPGPSVRNTFPGASNPLPGGGPRYNTAALYRPPVVGGSRPIGRPMPSPQNGDVVGPGSGSAFFNSNSPRTIGNASFSDTSGFSANLAMNGDRFDLFAHLGSGLAPSLEHSASHDGMGFHRHPGASYPIDGLTWPYLSYPYNYGYYPYYSSYYWPSYYGYVYGLSWPVVNYAVDQYADPALSAKYIPQAPQQQVQPAPPPPTALELATFFMQDRRFGEATEQFRLHLKTDPGDHVAVRWMGVAQLLAGKTKDGCATVGRAYAADAALGDSLLNLDEMGLSQLQVRELCGPVVAYAKRSHLPGAYVTAAMLMQVRNRSDLAIKMLSEGKTAGLDAELYAKLSQSMSK